MSAIAQLVFEKLKENFLKPKHDSEKEKVYFSFSENLIGFDNEDFNFLSPSHTDGDGARSQIENKLSFARVANKINRSSLWDISNSVDLSESYLQIINKAKLAEPNDERTVYNNAKAFLYKTADRVILSENEKSDAYKKYLEYKTAVAMLTRQLTELKTNSPQSTDEINDLQGQLNIVNTDWKYNGYQKEVESALKVIQGEIDVEALAGDIKSKFLKEWQGTMQSLQGLPFKETAIASAEDFYPVFCQPNDLYETGNLQWHSATLEDEELKQLIEKVKLNGDAFDEDDVANIAKIVVEYKIVELQRPWFRPDLLESSFWTLEEKTVVADPADLNNGLLPCYPTHFFFIKNLKYFVAPEIKGLVNDIPLAEKVLPEVRFKDLAGSYDKRKRFGKERVSIKQRKVSMGGDKTNKATAMVDKNTMTLMMKSLNPTDSSIKVFPQAVAMRFESKMHQIKTPIYEAKLQFSDTVKPVLKAQMEVANLAKMSFWDIFRRHKKDKNPHQPIVVSPVSTYNFIFKVNGASSVEEAKALLAGVEITITYVEDGTTDSVKYTGNIWDNKFVIEKLQLPGKHLIQIDDDDEIEDMEQVLQIVPTLTTYEITVTKRPQKLIFFKMIGAVNYKFPQLPNPLPNVNYI